jgi:simple sugar transport system permease protein
MHLAAVGFGPFDTDWLTTALVLTTPILLAAVGELISERAGILNVGLEGMMLAGAFFSYLVAWKSGSLLLGTFAGIAAGVLFAFVMGLLVIEARSDQIVSGVGINLAAIGLTGFAFDQIFGNREQIVVPTVGNIKIPGLGDIANFGPALFDHDPILYLAFLSVPTAWFLLYRTRWGLSLRAAGELPAAADTAGISVRRVRWVGVLTAGAMSGLGGAFLAIVDVGIFHQGMTAGRGFLALVAVIFGRWTPFGVLGACLALGATDALQLRLADDNDVPGQVWAVIAILALAFALYQLIIKRAYGTRRVAIGVAAGVVVSMIALLLASPQVDLPNEVWRSLPYLVALGVLGSALTRSRMPSKLTIPYARGEG